MKVHIVVELDGSGGAPVPANDKEIDIFMRTLALGIGGRWRSKFVAALLRRDGTPSQLWDIGTKRYIATVSATVEK